MMSLATPAGIGTTTVTLRVGQSRADAWRERDSRPKDNMASNFHCDFLSKTRTEIEREG
jgi:hypothetical protein